MKKYALILSASLGLAVHTQAAIVINDIILIDFGKIGEETAGNWNNIARAPSGLLTTTLTSTVLVADLKRSSDNLGTGVGLSVITPNFNGDTGIGGLTATANPNISFTGSGVIPSSAQTSVLYVANDAVVFTFTGLNNSLGYNVELLSQVGLARNPKDITIGHVTKNIDANDGLVHTFEFVQPNNGNLTITFAGLGPTFNTFHINALQLTAVPEPSAALLSGLGLLALLRRRR